MNSAEANTPLTAIQEQKKAIREQAHANRKDQEHKDELSREICARFMALPEYQRARTAMFYVDVRTEVRTRQDLATALAHGKTIVVPWCNDQGELELFRLESMEDLALGMYKILEPKPELRHLPERQVDVKSLDIVMVPGVAFTREGARMGHGKGYYDKLLEHARPDAPLVALAFECQLFPEIPTQSHDVFMDKIITEKGVYTGKGRSRS
ncbi:MAG: 5-formyltetrahydrofolate cyclo-ligase [Planctomycetaceae bacterium]|jgi:5-formyltetrahydrofolate cyclo-ligase